MTKCTCKDWEENYPSIEGIFLSAWTHGIFYEGKEFECCPWCGKELIQGEK